MTPADIIRAALERAGMSQSHCARQLGLSAKHVNQMCQGLAPVSVRIALELELLLPTISARSLLVTQLDMQLDEERQDAIVRARATLRALENGS